MDNFKRVDIRHIDPDWAVFWVAVGAALLSVLLG